MQQKKSLAITSFNLVVYGCVSENMPIHDYATGDFRRKIIPRIGSSSATGKRKSRRLALSPWPLSPVPTSLTSSLSAESHLTADLILSKA